MQCHIATQVHTTEMRERQVGSLSGVELLACITENKGIVNAESGAGKEQSTVDSHSFLRRFRSFVLNFYKSCFVRESR